MATSKNNDMYSYLDQLSTQELEDLLQKDMEAADGGDLDMVMYIMEVIEKREGGVSEVNKKAAAQRLHLIGKRNDPPGALPVRNK